MSEPTKTGLLVITLPLIVYALMVSISDLTPLNLRPLSETVRYESVASSIFIDTVVLASTATSMPLPLTTLFFSTESLTVFNAVSNLTSASFIEVASCI